MLLLNAVGVIKRSRSFSACLVLLFGTFGTFGNFGNASNLLQ